MSSPISRVDRATASKINPAISEFNARHTCELVSDAMRTLGHVHWLFGRYPGIRPKKRSSQPLGLETSDEDTDAFFLMHQTLAAALDYEAQPEEDAKPKEAPVTRVK